MSLAAGAFLKGIAAKSVGLAAGGLIGSGVGRGLLKKKMLAEHLKDISKTQLQRNLAISAIPAAALATRFATARQYEPKLDRSRQVIDAQHRVLQQMVQKSRATAQKKG